MVLVGDNFTLNWHCIVATYVSEGQRLAMSTILQIEMGDIAE